MPNLSEAARENGNSIDYAKPAMTPVLSHPWNMTETEARQLQINLATAVIKEDRLDDVRLVAGVDVAYHKQSDGLVAAAVILDATTLEVIETSITRAQVTFPYIPGLFSFRELPPLINSFSKLHHSPDLVICDGHGFMHPRRFGLACHLGVLFNVPAIGCGKTLLLGTHGPLDGARGSSVPIVDEDEVIGKALRTQFHTNPVYVSVGHKISLDTACKWVLKLSPKYRLPETTRQADQLVKIYLNS